MVEPGATALVTAAWIALALLHADDGYFADRAATGLEFLGSVLIGFLAADIGFVNFNNAPQKVIIIVVFAGFADALEHEPCGGLPNA